MGDWKTAWDHIHFQGFLGTKMILQFTWQGCDSLLAAPLVIDLARLADFEKRRGGAGLMRHLACFFKGPEGRGGARLLQAVRHADRLRGQGPAVRRATPLGGIPTGPHHLATSAPCAWPSAPTPTSGIPSTRRPNGSRPSATRGSNSWPTSPTPGPPACSKAPSAPSSRRWSGIRLAFSNMNAFMMNAVADHRQPYWYPSFIEPDPDYRRVRIDHTRRALSLCAELGAPHITTEPGGPLAPGQTRQQAIDLFVEVLKPLAEHAHDEGVLLLIEPEPGLLLETTDQYLEVAERLDAPSIGLNFDVGHAFCVERGPAEGRSPSWPPTPATTTSRTSRPPGSTTTWSRARGRSTSPRSWRRSAGRDTTAG